MSVRQVAPSLGVKAKDLKDLNGPMADPMLEVDDLVKVYEPSHVRAVDGISFQVQRGEIFGFLGPNGAGKSTTIKIVTTLLRKTAGRVRVGSVDLDRDPGAIRRMIGYAAQEVGIDDDLTGRENLTLQAHFYHLPSGTIPDRVRELLTTVDLVEAANRKAGTYSSGMRKRLDLATALIHQPDLLFLDEPTTGLDPQSRRAIWEYIEELNEAGTTIFLTTQYMEEADRLAHRLAIIDIGKLVAEGTPQKLKAEIGADVIRVDLKEQGGEQPRGVAREALAAVQGIRDIQDFEDGLVVYADDGSTLIPAVVRELDRAKVEIANLVFSPPSLDDVFLRHTGKKMRVEEVRPPTFHWGMRRRRGA